MTCLHARSMFLYRSVYIDGPIRWTISKWHVMAACEDNQDDFLKSIFLTRQVLTEKPSTRQQDFGVHFCWWGPSSPYFFFQLCLLMWRTGWDIVAHRFRSFLSQSLDKRMHFCNNGDKPLAMVTSFFSIYIFLHRFHSSKAILYAYFTTCGIC